MSSTVLANKLGDNFSQLFPSQVIFPQNEKVCEQLALTLYVFTLPYKLQLTPYNIVIAGDNEATQQLPVVYDKVICQGIYKMLKGLIS